MKITDQPFINLVKLALEKQAILIEDEGVAYMAAKVEKAFDDFHNSPSEMSKYNILIAEQKNERYFKIELDISKTKNTKLEAFVIEVTEFDNLDEFLDEQSKNADLIKVN